MIAATIDPIATLDKIIVQFINKMFVVVKLVNFATK